MELEEELRVVANNLKSLEVENGNIFLSPEAKALKIIIIVRWRRRRRTRGRSLTRRTSRT